MSQAQTGFLTLGQVAKRFGRPIWEVRRIYQSSKLPEPARIGNARVVSEADLPTIEAAMRKAGYIKTPAGVANAG